MNSTSTAHVDLATCIRRFSISGKKKQFLNYLFQVFTALPAPINAPLPVTSSEIEKTIPKSISVALL